MNKIDYFITKKKIPYNTKLKYLITIPCVNREERNAINVIDKTFEIFEKSGLFKSDNDNYEVSIMLFESGSNDTSYLNFLEKYNNNKVKLIYSSMKLDGNSNTLKMFYTISKLPLNLYDFIIWMDDDIFVCDNFMKNADAWIKQYSNYSLFSSLYVPYDSTPVIARKHLHLSNLPAFYGTCCTIFKPLLSKYVLPHWYNYHFNKFNYNPDVRFRESLRKEFPNANKICVSYPSLVEHMNIGSAIKMKKETKIGHKAKFFIGCDKDPMIYNIL